MNLNGINQVQQQAVQTKKTEKHAETPTFAGSETAKQKSDAGCLKNYFFGSKVAFGGMPCSTSNFAVKRLKDVPCCCCGKPMLRNEDLEYCKNEVAKRSGKELSATLKAYSKYMRADEKAVGTILANEAEQSGCGLSQAMRQTSQNIRELTGQYTKGILTGLDEMAKEEFASEKNPVSELIAKANKGIDSGRGLDRVQFTESLEKAYGSLGEKSQHKLQDAAMDLPLNFNQIERIYGKYAAKKDGDIARRLFSTALTTAEHIHPHSLGGPDNTANYIAECAGCNNPRGNMSYAEWLKVHPEYPRKAQDHIEHVQARLLNGELNSKYNDYPVDVRGSLSKESGGRMVLKVLNPSTIEKMREAKGKHGKYNEQDVREAYDKQQAEKSENNENNNQNKKIKK